MARRDKKEERAIAHDRIERLVDLAEATLTGPHPERATRYGDIAWRVKTTYQLRSTAIDGRRCKNCKTFLTAQTMRVRLRSGRRVVTCLHCGAMRRRPLLVRDKPAGDNGPGGNSGRAAIPRR